MRFFIVILLLCLVKAASSQILDNGSLEGNPGTNTPVNWFSCLPGSTVDVQPGVWGVTLPAQDGNTYINMVCRGPEQQNRDSCEELSQTLNQTLEAGKCYRFEVYLAYFPDFGVTAFRNPLDLVISAGVDACSRDLEIGRYESIDHADWRRYVTYINPSQDLNGMLMEAEWSSLPIYSGHVLIDNMSIEEITDPPVQNLILCEGETLQLDAYAAEDATTISWSNGQEGTSITVSVPGTYTAEILLGNCLVTETFEVSLQEAPAIELTTRDSLCPEQELTLDATLPNAIYVWDDGSTAATRTITGPGFYTVSVTVGECTNEYRILLRPQDCSPVLEMPNAFTPNGDGKNDLLTPRLIQYISTMETVIYNRWGEDIFSTTNRRIEWDGRLPNGEEAPPATYYYRVAYTDLQGNVLNLRGTVTLIK